VADETLSHGSLLRTPFGGEPLFATIVVPSFYGEGILSRSDLLSTRGLLLRCFV
jgi:hypothetical protein